MTLISNNKRIIQDVPTLPAIGESRYIYRNTTDGYFYSWNEPTSQFNKLSNTKPIYSDSIANVLAAGEEDGQFLYITNTGDEFGVIDEVYVWIGGMWQAYPTPTSTSKVQHEVKLGEVINVGQAVYVDDADGTNMIVLKASNNTEATSSKTLGLLAISGSNNDLRPVTTEGLLAGLDTSTATAGDPVWLGTDGDLIFGLANKPVAPAHLVYIGVVTRVQQNNGEIFVKVQNGYEIEELHNVLITSLQNGHILKYNSTSGLWENSAETQANFSETNALSPAYIQNKPTVTSGVGTPIGTATIGSIYIEKDILGNEVGSYTFNGTNWVSLAFSQVQADWTETDTSNSGFIQNKPTLANVAISGDYSSLLNKPVIPVAQIQSDYTQTDNTQADFIKNKPNLSVYELVANKGVPNGYVPLNASGTVDSQYLNIAGTEYKGTWSPVTNTPTLADGVGTNGWFYYVSIDGSVNLGSGIIEFKEGNIVIYDTASGKWKKVGGQQLITNDLDISLTDFTVTTAYYYGGNTDAGDWQVNKWNISNNTKTIANVTNNSTYTSLPTAWVDRLTLNYI